MGPPHIRFRLGTDAPRACQWLNYGRQQPRSAAAPLIAGLIGAVAAFSLEQRSRDFFHEPAS
jgi:hypothetical protein